jgi:ArsR family transcriptional regulator
MTQMSKRSKRRRSPRPAGRAPRLDPRVFRGLGDPRRSAILRQLLSVGRPCTVGELAGCCPTDFSVVSRHLATLREAGILRAEKRGRQVYYFVQSEPLVALLRALADCVENCCCAAKPRKKGRSK